MDGVRVYVSLYTHIKAMEGRGGGVRGGDVVEEKSDREKGTRVGFRGKRGYFERRLLVDRRAKSTVKTYSHCVFRADLLRFISSR